MKKINLFLSTLIVALVILVIGGATIAPVSQFNASALQPAYNADGRATGTQLFDAKGRYQVDLTNLKDGIKTLRISSNDCIIEKLNLYFNEDVV